MSDCFGVVEAFVVLKLVDKLGRQANAEVTGNKGFLEIIPIDLTTTEAVDDILKQSHTGQSAECV